MTYRPATQTRHGAIYLKYRDGMTMQALADQLLISRERVRQLIVRYETEHALKKYRHKRSPPARQIAARSCEFCYEWFDPNYDDQRFCSRKCSRRSWAKHHVTTTHLKVMIEDYKSGMTYREVGLKYHAPTMTVFHALKRAGVKSRIGGPKRKVR